MELRFNREEIAGALGNLGSILPLACAMVIINTVDPTAVFISMGTFYILSGLYFRVPISVEPMKVIAAYSIATSLSSQKIAAAALWMGVILLILGLSRTITFLAKYIPNSCVRGIQLTTGVLLFMQGIKFIVGKTPFQISQGKAEPFLSIQTIGPVPIGIIIGIIATLLVLFLLDNKKFPAALVVICGSILVGLIIGGWKNILNIKLGLYLPNFISPLLLNSCSDLVIIFSSLVLPQLPLTIGNAIISQADLSKEYFGERANQRCTPAALSTSMGLANIAISLIGGIPLCHGAGGLVAHYRFGARTAMSNFILGSLFIIMGFFIGPDLVALISLIPVSVLGTLLCFTGAYLSMMIMDLKEKSDLFIAITTLCVTLSINLFSGFCCAIVLAYLFKYSRHVRV